MNGFVEFIEQKLMPIASKVGMQRHHRYVTINDRWVFLHDLTEFSHRISRCGDRTVSGSFGYSLSLYSRIIGIVCNIWDCFIASQKLQAGFIDCGYLSNDVLSCNRCTTIASL